MQNDFDRFYRGLNFIIVGLVFCIVDFKLGSFDILNDFVGIGLIFFALWEFSRQTINQAYKSAINLAFGAALLEFLLGLVNYLVASDSEIMKLLNHVIEIFVLYGLIMFARAMQIYSAEKGLGLSLGKWQKVEKLYFWMYFIPFGALSLLLAILSTLSIFDMSSFVIPFSFAPILVVLFLLIWPLIQTIRVIIGMKREMLN